MAATLDEWVKIAQEGSLYGSVFCGLITASFGAAACGAAAVYISSRLNELDTGNHGGDCFALRPRGAANFTLLPKPGGC
jgi:hypothetical protein